MEEEIAAALNVLRDGGVLLYPTDTIWGIGCRASDSRAVERIYELKRRPGHKAMLCLVADVGMLRRYTGEISDSIAPIVFDNERPTTVIYPRVQGVAPELLGHDGSLGIRLTRDPYCRRLVSELGEALVSTSANISGEPNPAGYRDISPVILKGVDYIVNLRRDEIQSIPSRILKANEDGTLEVLRD